MIDQCGSCMGTRMVTAHLPKIARLLLAVAAASAIPGSLARAAAVPECSMSVTLADWGENSAGDIDVASGGSCQFAITMRGTVSSSDISQKPTHGKLKKVNLTTFEYRTKAKYKGSDTFAIKVIGQGPTRSGTSVVTVNATIK